MVSILGEDLYSGCKNVGVTDMIVKLIKKAAHFHSFNIHSYTIFCISYHENHNVIYKKLHKTFHFITCVKLQFFTDF